MALTVFYSWQSDAPSSTNRNFIEKALRNAVKRVNLRLQSQGSFSNYVFQFDKDTLNAPGTPPVTDTILDKISKCAIFVPDLTFIAKTNRGRKLPNPNVLIEHGYALKTITSKRIIPIMNTAFGKVTENNLPFNMRHLRHPLTYALNKNTNTNSQKLTKERLTDGLVKGIEAIVKDGILELKAKPYEVNFNNSGNLFWLGHDLMWVLHQILTGENSKPILRGLRVAIHQLRGLGLSRSEFETRLLDLKSQANEIEDKNIEWTESIRNGFYQTLKGLIDDIGASATKNQPDYKSPGDV